MLLFTRRLKILVASNIIMLVNPFPEWHVWFGKSLLLLNSASNQVSLTAQPEYVCSIQELRHLQAMRQIIISINDRIGNEVVRYREILFQFFSCIGLRDAALRFTMLDKDFTNYCGEFSPAKFDCIGNVNPVPPMSYV